MRVEWSDGHVSHFHMIWLRDHDYAATVEKSHTNQRVTDTAFDVPLSISANSIEVLSGGSQLRIKWSHVVEDVDSSTFHAAWLRSNCYKEHAAARAAESKALHAWGSEIGGKLLTEMAVPYSEMMEDDRALLRLLHITNKYGVAIVSGTPRDKDISQRVCERVGPVRHTFYGGFWETVVLPPEDDKNIDSAYSTVALPAHTDGSYWVDPPGIQAFHCLQSDPQGGATLLVDGFKVAEELKERDPEAFEFLCETPLPFQHRDPENHVVAMHTVFGRCELGHLNRFSMNALDRDTLHLPPDQVPLFYKAWQALVAVVQDPALECWHRLEPGGLILIDNQRVMHGRSAFTASSGRILVGCYISREDWRSTKRVLESRFH